MSAAKGSTPTSIFPILVPRPIRAASVRWRTHTALVVLNALFEERFGGPQSLVLQVAERLRREAVETIVVIPRGDPTFATLLDQAGIACRQLDLARPRKTLNPAAHARFAAGFWPSVNALRRLIRESKAAIVHTNGLMNLQAAMAARLEGVRLVWHLNDLGTPRAVQRACLPFLRAWADRIAVGARAIGDFYFPGAAEMARIEARLHVVYPPVDPERFRPAVDGAPVRAELGIPPEAPVIGAVANLSPGKGIEFLIEAAPRIKQRFPDSRFMLAGERLTNRSAYWSALVKRAKELGLARDFIFTGPRRDMPRVYRAMTVYAHPSESEGCSVAVLEASSSGVPVVATDVGGTREAVEPEVTGLLIQPRRPAEIADAVIRLLDSPTSAERMAAAARARMIERFSLELCAQEHLRMYHAALGHARSSITVAASRPPCAVAAASRRRLVGTPELGSRRALNILLLSQYYRPEQVGPAIWLAELAQDLTDAGHRVSVLTSFPNHPDGVVGAPYRGRVFQRERLDGIDVTRTYIYATPRRTFARRAVSFGSFIASSLLGGALAAPHADVIYATLPPLPLGVTAAALAGLKSAKLVVNLQDIHPDVAVQTGVLHSPSAIRFFQGMERWVYRHSDRIVVISEVFRQNLFQKGVPAAKLRVVPNWADPDFVTPGCRDETLRDEWGRGKFVTVYSGGLTHNSALEPLIEAAAALASEPFQFVIIGDGVKRQSLEETARSQGLSNVRFLPFQPLDRYPRVLATPDVNLVTLNAASVAASVPSKIYKLMASGRPVLAIVPRASEIARLVEESACGFVVEPAEIQDLVRVLRHAASHESELARMGRSGRLYLEQHLARRIATAKIEEVLRAVVQGG